jgi:hypothetical protein
MIAPTAPWPGLAAAAAEDVDDRHLAGHDEGGCDSAIPVRFVQPQAFVQARNDSGCDPGNLPATRTAA